jgi:hypothetical protein
MVRTAVAALELQFQTVALHLGQLGFFLLRFEGTLEGPDLIFLNDDTSAAPRQLGFGRPQTIFDALKFLQPI